jgi:FKBP-type peptidyl-prolyl cis-trans isomerase FkpA
LATFSVTAKDSMKLKLTLTAAFVAALALTACGSSDDSPVQVPPATTNPAAPTTKDISIGTGIEATLGKTISVQYTGWLYDSTKSDFKGTRFETTVGGNPATFALKKGDLIEGWVQGIPGMKVGGKRSLIFPASMGYGSSGRGSIPPNAGLVFEVELISVQ